MAQGYVKNVKQSDHRYMITNYPQAYLKMLKDVIERLDVIELSSILEFNSGNTGLFTGLINDLPENKLKNYRLMDTHPQCVADSYQENETARNKRPDIGYSTHVGNIWEYEIVVPVSARYRADVVVVHYLSAVPKERLEQAINEICRVSVKDIIILDYAPADCPIDIVYYMKEEMPSALVHVSISDVFDKLKFNYCIYHVVKPPNQ